MLRPQSAYLGQDTACANTYYYDAHRARKLSDDMTGVVARDAWHKFHAPAALRYAGRF